MDRTIQIALAGLCTLALAEACADDTAKLAALFAPAAERGGTVTIPPGDYALDGAQPVRLASHTTVFAYGARFHLPEVLGDKARVVLFSGENVSDFRWFGGHFSGHVFDPAREENSWEPNANTRAILITTTPGGETKNLTFRDVTSDGLAGAAISVAGAEKRGSDREIEAYARNVTVENCTLERSGKFMWDYGLLWQITVWPEDYSPRERAMAAKYFRNDLIRGGVTMADGDDRVRIDNREKPIAVSASDEPQYALCFFGGALPRNIVRGRQYFVVESSADGIKLAEQPGGTPINSRARVARSEAHPQSVRRVLGALCAHGRRAGQRRDGPGRLRKSHCARLPLERAGRHHAHPEKPRHCLRGQPHHRLADGGVFPRGVLPERDRYRQYHRRD